MIAMYIFTRMFELALRTDRHESVRIIAGISALGAVAGFGLLIISTSDTTPNPSQIMNGLEGRRSKASVISPRFSAANEEWAGHIQLTPADIIVVVYTERSVLSDPRGSIVPGDVAWFGRRVRGWAPRLSSQTGADTLGWAQVHELSIVR